MEKGYVFYTLFDHIPCKKSDFSQSGLCLYKLDTDEIYQGTAHPVVKEFHSQPIGQPIICFDSPKYPVCMGGGMLEDKLYFFGGCFPHQGEAPRGAPLMYSRNLYILDLRLIEDGTPPELVEKHAIQIRDTKNYVQKLNPIVVTVNNKLYVVPVNFAPEANILPTIQSYDPRGDSWENYDIFELLKDDPYFNHIPDRSISRIVIAHCVEGSQIVIVLKIAAYSFDVVTGAMKLIGNHTDSVYGLPFRGLGAVLDDCYFGVSQPLVYGYKDRPFGKIFEPFAATCRTIVSQFPHIMYDIEGLIINLADAKEKKLLVVRNAHHFKFSMELTELRKHIFLFLDILSIAKGVDGNPKCTGTHSTIFHMDGEHRRHYGCIKACFLYKKQTGMDYDRDESSMYESIANGSNSCASVVMGDMSYTTTGLALLEGASQRDTS